MGVKVVLFAYIVKKSAERITSKGIQAQSLKDSHQRTKEHRTAEKTNVFYATLLTNENRTLFPSETSLDELNESTNFNIFDSNNDSVEIPTQSLSRKHVQEFENGSKRKKRKADEIKPSITEDDLAQHLNAFEVSMKEFITEKFESMSKSNVVDNSKDKFSNSSILDRISRDAINRCRSLAELKEVIEPDFHFDYESSQVYYQLCVQDSRPARSITNHRSGVFNFNYSSYVFAAASMQKQQPSLLRLKAHIVEYIHESQTHKTLLGKRAFDNEKEKERQLRAYNIGMNIGRIRYNEIKQGRSYLDFGKDLFLAHLNKTDIGDINNSGDLTK